MRLLLLAVGRMKEGPERELFRRYFSRAQAGAKAVGLTDVALVELEEGRSRQPDQRKQDEAAALLGKIPPGARVLLLDEGGSALGSRELSVRVSRARDRGETSFCFVIGGADGLAPELLSRHDRMSFGAATFPHQLVRVMAAEQIYRITTILAGHPYHRD